MRLSVLFIDLDGFKAVNDTLGHAMGDHMLRQAADVLRHHTRDADLLGRFGGDEFVVALAAYKERIDEVSQDVAARIVGSIAALGHGLGCSIGIAVWARHETALQDILSAADQAMYEAKRRGKNGFVLSTGS